MEYVRLAACKFRDQVWCGRRHHEILRQMFFCAGGEVLGPERIIQGFVTAGGRFVEREEAMIIATKANQIKRDCHNPRMLFSENLY